MNGNADAGRHSVAPPPDAHSVTFSYSESMRATISRRPQVALAIAVVAGLMALMAGTATVRKAEKAARSSFIEVPVAARPLAEGTVMVADDVRIVRIPPDAMPGGLAAEIAG